MISIDNMLLLSCIDGFAIRGPRRLGLGCEKIYDLSRIPLNKMGKSGKEGGGRGS